MKLLWCWRCSCEMPMLDGDDEQQFHAVHDAYLEKFETSEGDELLSFYFDKTGFSEANLNAVSHHLASLYGPPCRVCGKPLRTPQASLCATCGTAA